MTRAAIALGSNLGDRLGHLRAGLDGLGELGEVGPISRLYETEPVGGPEQGRYLNAIAVIETEEEPRALLSALLEIERSRGRERIERWGPRTLDLDLIVFGGQSVDSTDLEVPHPRAHERGFVVVPLAEVWPDAVLADASTAVEATRRIGLEGLKPWEGEWRSETPHLGRAASRWVWAQVMLFMAWLAVAVFTAVDLTGVRAGVGGGVIAVGVALMEASRRRLGSNLTPYPQPATGTTLTEDGVYRVVRHPIYAAVILLLSGGSLVAGSLPAAGVVVIVAIFFSAKADVEERALSISVPGYPEYLEDVPYRLIPGVW